MRVAIIADPHLKAEGNKRDETTGLNARFLDRARSLEWAVTDARERGCETLLFAGDLFDTARPTTTQNTYAQNIFRAFTAGSDNQIIAIPGNHDMPRAANEATAIEPVFGGVRGATVSLTPEVIDCGDFSLVTLPYPRRAQLAAALPQYSELAPEAADKLLGALLIDILRGLHAQCDPAKPSILLAHTSIDVSEIRGSIMAERDICLPLREIPEFTYSAFGHIHARQDFSKYGRPNVFHVGSTDRGDFGEEGQAKYYAIVDFAQPGWAQIEIPCREYRTVHVEYGVSGQIAGEDLAADCKGAICRVKLRRPESVKPDLAYLEREIRDAGCFDFYGVEQEVVREAAVRSEAVTKAKSVEELLGIWWAAKDCKQPLGELVAMAETLEAEVAA